MSQLLYSRQYSHSPINQMSEDEILNHARADEHEIGDGYESDVDGKNGVMGALDEVRTQSIEERIVPRETEEVAALEIDQLMGSLDG